MAIDVGEIARIRLQEIRNEDGELEDPSEIVLVITKPDGTSEEKTLGKGEVQKESEGYFYYLLTVDEAGIWRYTWTTEGVVVVHNGAFETGAPTAEDIREWSKVDFDELEFEQPEGGADPLRRVVRKAMLWLQHTTGRLFTEFENETTEEEYLLESMRQAVLMLVEHAVYVAQPEHAETSADFNQIRSFSAGSYSETRRGTNERSHGLHPWADLADLIWDLMTEEKRTALVGGPAIKTDSEPQWNVGADIMGPGDKLLTPFGPFVAPWDPIIETLYN